MAAATEGPVAVRGLCADGPPQPLSAPFALPLARVADSIDAFGRHVHGQPGPGHDCVGDNAVLTLTYEGGQPRSVPAPPDVRNLQIISSGTSRMSA